MELPVDVHVGLWSAAPAKLFSQSRYAALLVSMHGVALQSRRDLAKLTARERELVRGYLDGQRKLQLALIERLGRLRPIGSSCTVRAVRCGDASRWRRSCTRRSSELTRGR